MSDPSLGGIHDGHQSATTTKRSTGGRTPARRPTTTRNPKRTTPRRSRGKSTTGKEIAVVALAGTVLGAKWLHARYGHRVQVDPAHRRIGLGLVHAVAAVVVGAAVWADRAGPAGTRATRGATALLGWIAFLLPGLRAVRALRLMRPAGGFHRPRLRSSATRSSPRSPPYPATSHGR
ncbi:hypothetical protein [Micromonospora sp. NPDC004551]|uniref:hypothetical protein n=1 Tax=Micromonospora sp. NPDC004551 TaxID=3154284 RepID=UPI0033B53418